MDDTDILTHGRRLHNALRYAIEDGDGLKGESRWEEVERPGFEHHACGMYLTSILATLEGEIGIKCWNMAGQHFDQIHDFIEACPRNKYKELDIKVERLDALHEIRNAVTHNSGNVRRNRNSNSESMILDAEIPGVKLDVDTGIITLVSNYDVDFMEWTRVAYLCVTEYHEFWGGPKKWM